MKKLGKSQVNKRKLHNIRIEIDNVNKLDENICSYQLLLYILLYAKYLLQLEKSVTNIMNKMMGKTYSFKKLLGDMVPIIIKALSTSYRDMKIHNEITNSGKEINWHKAGSKKIKFNTLYGKFVISLPKHGSSTVQFEWLKNNYNKRDYAVLAATAYQNGLSYSEVKNIFNETFKIKISEASLCKLVVPYLQNKIYYFKKKKFSSNRKVITLHIDVTHAKVKSELTSTLKKYLSNSLYVAVATFEDGRREVVGFDVVQGSESSEGWMNLFTKLKNNGLPSPQIIVKDGSRASIEPARLVFGNDISIQTCTTHILRNIRNLGIDSKEQKELHDDFYKIFKSKNKNSFKKRLYENIVKYQRIADDLKAIFSDEFIETYLEYSPLIHELVRSTNIVESINQKIKRNISHHMTFSCIDSIKRAVIPRLALLNMNYNVTFARLTKNKMLITYFNCFEKTNAKYKVKHLDIQIQEIKQTHTKILMKNSNSEFEHQYIKKVDYLKSAIITKF